ncbi:MAG: SNF2-related protein, partial [bacterium]
MGSLYTREYIQIEPLYIRLASQTTNILLGAGIERVEELARCNPDQLLELRNVGKKRLEEMENLLHNLGLSWGMNISYQEESPLPESFREFLYLVTADRWFERGEKYLKQGRVLECEPVDGFSFQEANTVRARVKGSKNYNIRLDIEEQIYECSCPVNRKWRRWGGACKHVIAATLELACQIRQEQFLNRDLSTNWATLASSLRKEIGIPGAKPEFSYILKELGGGLIIIPARKFGEELERVDLSAADPNDPSLQPEDRLILTRLKSVQSGFGWLPDERANRAIGDVLRLLTDRDIYFQRMNENPLPLDISSKQAELQFALSAAEDAHYEFKPIINLPESAAGKEISGHIILQDPLWFLTESMKLYPVESVEVSRKLLDYSSGESITFSKEEAADFTRLILPLVHESGTSLQIENNIMGEKQILPEGRLELEEKHKQLLIRFCVQYDSTVLKPGTGKAILVYDEAQQKFIAVNRDLELESELKQKFELSGVEPSAQYETYYRVSEDPIEWLMEELPKLTANGFRVYGEESLTRFSRPKSMTRSEFVVRGNIDWFDLDGEIEFDDKSVSLSKIRSTILNGERFVQLGGGELGAIPQKWLDKWKKLFEWSKPRGDVLEVPRASASWINQFAEEADQSQVDEVFRETLEKLEAADKPEPLETPAGFKGSLRPYQKEGLAWLNYLNKTGLGALLADDMGLGKTIQVLALLQHRFNETGQYPHTLVVCPRSVLRNWEREAAKFIPELEVYKHHGADRPNRVETWPGADLVMTTYGTLIRDVDILAKQNFELVVLDESHRIRNPHTKRARAVCSLKPDHRICLTGTPVQNTTMDLWAQFQFLNRGFLGTRKGFKRALARPIEANGDKEANQKLQKFIKPFVLRRTKTEVAKDLPPLSEMKIDCEMPEPQKNAYDKTRNQYRRMLSESLQEQGMDNSRFLILEGLTRLRQICCHPELAGCSEAVSAKSEMFKEKAAEAIRNGHRVLVFSQFVQFLKKLTPIAEEQGWKYEYLDGQTVNRLDRVDDFQGNKDISLFFISLKAGGEGLNLTGADLVFLMDPWWNPAVEQQAADRTHRIGQDK